MLSTLTFTKPPYIAVSDELCTHPGVAPTWFLGTAVWIITRGSCVHVHKRNTQKRKHLPGTSSGRAVALRSYIGPPIKASTLPLFSGLRDGLPISLAHWPA